MTIAVNDLVDKVELILQDTTNVRWTAAELVGWIDDGQREIVILKPEASVTNEAVQLAAGTKQTIPSGGVMLIDVVRNTTTGDATPGNAIRQIARRILDDQVPTWHSDTTSATIKHFMFDDSDPTHYYVYPKATTSNYVTIVYSSAPTAAAVGGNIGIPDIYANALIDYALYRAYSKDADYAENAQRAIAHYQAFRASVGSLDESEARTEPK